MLRRASRHLLALSAACAAARPAPGLAQVQAGLDAAVSVVKYSGYLASGAANLTPSVAWRSARTTLAARGTFLVFESGNTSTQGLVTAGTFTPALGRFRVEAAAEAGASAYATFARYSHALARLRLHLLSERWGLWVGPLGGGVSRGEGTRAAAGASVGWWARAPAGALEVALTRIGVGDTVYTDLEGRARWRRGPLDIEGSAGARVASRGGGAGVYGDASAALRLTGALDLVVAAGTYPSDPVRGSIPGRYATLGLRFTSRAPPRLSVIRQMDFPASDSGDAPGRLANASVAVEQLDGLAVLTVQVRGARRVEVMGDFTDWQPVPLAAAGTGRYRYALSLPAGLHRFNLRLDGGPWGVPRGATQVEDEFGGSVGILVVP